MSSRRNDRKGLRLRSGGRRSGGPTPPYVTPFFYSEWPHAIGDTAPIMQDGGRWDSYQGTPGSGAGQIIAPGSVPGTQLLGRGNIMQVRAQGLFSAVVIKDECFPASVFGTATVWSRQYIRCDLQTAGYVFQHLVAHGGIGPPIMAAIGVGCFEPIPGVTPKWSGIFNKTLYDATGAPPVDPNNTQWNPQNIGDLVPHDFYDPAGRWLLVEVERNFNVPWPGYVLGIIISSCDANGMIVSELFNSTNHARNDAFNAVAGDMLSVRQGATVNFGISAPQGPSDFDGMRKLVLGNESAPAAATGESVYVASIGYNVGARLADAYFTPY